MIWSWSALIIAGSRLLPVVLPPASSASSESMLLSAGGFDPHAASASGASAQARLRKVMPTQKTPIGSALAMPAKWLRNGL